MALPQGREEYYLSLFQQAEANQDLQALQNLRTQYLAENSAVPVTPTAAMTGQRALQQSTPQYATPPSAPTNWFENVADAAKVGWQNIGPAVASGVTGAADILGYDDWANEQRRLREGYDAAVKEYGTFADVSPSYDPNRTVVNLPGEMFDLKSSGVESIAGSAPLLPVGVLGSLLAPTGAVAGTIGAGASIFATMFPAFFDEAKKEGFDDARAVEQGMFRAAAEAGPEALWITRVFSRIPGMKNFLGNALDAAGTQGLTEVATEGLNMLYDMFRRGEDIEGPEAAHRLAQAFTIGTAGGVTMGTPILAAQAAADAMTPATPEYAGQIAQQEMDARQGLLPEQKGVFANRDAALAEAQQREAAGIEPGLASRTTEATRGYYDPSIQRANVFVQEIYDSLATDPNTGEVVRKPSKREVQKAVRDVVAEEVDDHMTFLNMLEDREGFLTKYGNINKGSINKWRASPDGQIYADYDQARATAEYISYLARTEGISSGRVRSLIASIKLYLRKKGILGFNADFSDQHILDLLTKASAQAARGTPGQLPTVTSQGLLESKGPQDPSRRRFMKQVGGAAAGAALDPSILLEPATQAAAEAPAGYAGMAEQLPGSVYEFSIATDPYAGWTSTDDPGEGAMDVAFTHDPNTNEVTVYEGDEVVDEFMVDDTHADAEVLEYVRDKYGRENINDARVQREEMARDPITGEGGFDYWGDADQNFDNMAQNIISGEQTMAGVERLVTPQPEDAFDDYDAPGAFEADQEAARLEREDIQRRLNELESQDDKKPVPQKWRELDTPALEALTQERRTAGNPSWRAMQKELDGRTKALPAPEETTEKTDSEQYVETIDEIMNVYDEDATAAEAAADGTLNDRIISYAAETPFTREELWEGVNQRIEALEDPEILEARVRKPKKDTIVRDISNRMSKKIRPGIAKLDISEEEKAARLDLASRLRGVMGAPARKRGIDAGDFEVFVEQSQNILDGNLEAVEEFIAPFAEQMTGTREKVRKAGARRDQRAKRLGKTDAEILKYRPKGGKHPMEGQMTYPFAQEEINRLEEEGEITAEEAEIRRLAVNNVRRIFKGKAGPTVKRTVTEAVYGIGNYEDLVPWSEVYTEEQTTDMGERAEVAQAEAARTRYDATDITNKQKQELLKAPPTAEELSWIESDAMPSLSGKRARLLFLRAPTEFKSPAEQREFEAWREDQKGFVQKEFKEKEAADREAIIEELKREGRYTRLPPGTITHYKDSQPARVIKVDPIAMERMGPTDDVGIETDFQYADTEYTEQGEAIDPDWFQWTDNEGNDVVVPDKILESRAEQIYQSDLDPTEGVLVSHGAKLLPVKHKGVTYWTSLNEFEKLTEERPSTSAWRYNREAIIRMSKEWRGLKVNRDRKEKDEEIKRIIEREIIPELSKETGIVHSPDHMVPLRGYGLDFAWNIFPLPKSWNESLKDRSIHTSQNENIQEFVKYLKEHAEDSKKSTMQIYLEALKASGLWKPSENIKDIADRIQPFPEPEIAPRDMKQLAGIPRILTAYGYVHPQSDKYGKALPFIPQDAKLPEWQARLIDPYFLESRAGKEHFMLDSRRRKGKDKGYSEHFNDGFWYRLTGYMWGKPVQSIRDFNKVKRFGTEQGGITAADEIADLIQRSHSSTRRAEGLEGGTDMMQDVSQRSGEFYSELSKIFASVTDRLGIVGKRSNSQMVDYLMGRDVKFKNKKERKAAEDLKALMEKVYSYAKDETKGLPEVLDLRGEGDSLLPRVWNIEYMATRQGKSKFLRVVSDAFSAPGSTTPIFEGADITIEDLYDTVINSGGFVQGEWTNLKADQLRSDKDIEKDLKVQEYLDTLPTESLIDDNLVLDDLQAVVPRFIQKAIERTEYSKRFGKNDEKLRELLKKGVQQIRKHNREVLRLKADDDPMPYINEKRFEKSVWDMAKILRNKYGYDMANMSTRKWLQRGSNMATVMKLPLVTLASLPEFFTPMLKGDVSPHHWFMDIMAGSAWAGYKGASGMSKLLFNKHLPAMRKYSKDIGGLGVISDIQLLRELGIADIQAMGDLVSTRYANPNFARGGLRAGAGGSIAGNIPKHVRGVFNMQTFMQATMLTTLTEMQQLMALRNFQRHMGRRVKFVDKNKGKSLKGRKAKLFKQFKQDLLDYGITEDIDLSTSAGQAAFNSGALRFIDQVITRPNDATTAKAFKNPLTAPLVLFKRFITTYGNTLLTSVGNDFATKVDNVERAKQVGKVAVTAMAMYGAVMFAEIIRGAIKGDLDDDDFEIKPKDFQQFMRRLDRTGLLTAPGTAAVNLTFPYKRGWWDTTQSRMMGELLGPLGGDATAFGDALLSDKDDAWGRFVGQMLPLSKPLMGGATGAGRPSPRSRTRTRTRSRERD